jgi:hypothetical protein
MVALATGMRQTGRMLAAMRRVRSDAFPRRSV